MHEDNIPGKIGGFLGKFQLFLPTDRKVRMAIQSFIENRLERKEVLEKNSVRCVGKIIYINVHPYLKQEIVAYSGEILGLLKDRDRLYFDQIR